MAETTISKRKFAQDMRAAEKAASKGPVVITDRGRPAHVLLSYEDYRRLKREEPNLADLLRQDRTVEPNIADLLYMPEAADIEFDPPKLNLKLKIPDLS